MLNAEHHGIDAPIVFALEKWYDRLLDFHLQSCSTFSMNCLMMDLSNTIHSALLTIPKSSFNAGWSLLHDAGLKVRGALQQRHPGTLPELLLLFSHLQNIREENEAMKPTVTALVSLLLHTRDHLSITHPTKLSLALLLQAEVSRIFLIFCSR